VKNKREKERKRAKEKERERERKKERKRKQKRKKERVEGTYLYVWFLVSCSLLISVKKMLDFTYFYKKRDPFNNL